MSNNYLLLIAHGTDDGNSHSHTLANLAKKVLEASGHKVETLDLLKAGFNSQLSRNDFPGHENDHPLVISEVQRTGSLNNIILDAQAKLIATSNVIVFGPLWCYRLPAIIYSFFERVFTPGFGYDFSKKREEFK
jgi:putative NADPH-quinone reductase